jgi:hypothetical protein
MAPKPRQMRTKTPLHPGRRRAWSQVLQNLPTYLEELLASPTFGRGPERISPPTTHGVYLFSERGKDLYVGRCGITERARIAGKGHSNFRTRLAGHTRPSAAHNQATFAWRLTAEALGDELALMPKEREARQFDERFRKEFFTQKERVTAMEFRVVEIPDDFESYVFEPYAALILDTPYNSWATS